MEENTNANFEFYPNPAANQITLKVDNQLLGSIYTICDNTGKSVLNGNILSEQSVIDLEYLSKGIYFLSIGENFERTVKVIKE
jgi:hypothetical protein